MMNLHILIEGTAAVGGLIVSVYSLRLAYITRTNIRARGLYVLAAACCFIAAVLALIRMMRP